MMLKIDDMVVERGVNGSVDNHQNYEMDSSRVNKAGMVRYKDDDTDGRGC